MVGDGTALELRERLEIIARMVNAPSSTAQKGLSDTPESRKVQLVSSRPDSKDRTDLAAGRPRGCRHVNGAEESTAQTTTTVARTRSVADKLK